MGRKPKPSSRADPEAIVGRVCRAVLELDRRTGRHYVTVDQVVAELALPDATVVAAIDVASSRHWIRGHGRPPHTVEITETGKAAIAD